MNSGAGITNEERVRLLADLAGINVTDEDLSEVANRFASLMDELDRLKELDLSNVQPVVIFAEEP
jgi:Asp-tRNA(Asn)/Glu-tRNA(Gln) amidotransferase C subunit